jgi:hypothetical protein
MGGTQKCRAVLLCYERVGEMPAPFMLHCNSTGRYAAPSASRVRQQARPRRCAAVSFQDALLQLPPQLQVVQGTISTQNQNSSSSPVAEALTRDHSGDILHPRVCCSADEQEPHQRNEFDVRPEEPAAAISAVQTRHMYTTARWRQRSCSVQLHCTWSTISSWRSRSSPPALGRITLVPRGTELPCQHI